MTRNRQNISEIFALTGILLLAGYLRLHNFADNPGWYTDEATHVLIAKNLIQGQIRYMAIDQSFLIFARLPLFEYMLAGIYTLFPPTLPTLRIFTALLGTLTVGILYLAVQSISRDRIYALLAAFLLAVYPQAVLYSRMGFSYNLLPPLVISSMVLLYQYVISGSRKSLLASSLVVGIGCISDFVMFAFAACVIVCILVVRWRDLLWSIPLIVMPFLLYSVWMLLTVPNTFIFDMSYTLSRTGGTPLNQQIGSVVDNYTTLFAGDMWISMGLIGLFFIKPVRFIGVTTGYIFVPILMVGRTAALHGLSFYYMIPLLPLFMIGLGALLRYGVPKAWERLQSILPDHADRRIKTVTAGMLIVIIIVVPFAYSILALVDNVETGFQTQIDPFLISPTDAAYTALYLNDYTKPDDTVIVTAPIGWMLQAQTVDFQMAAVAEGMDAVHLPGSLPKDRFAFDAHYQTAQYVVVDNLWRNWGAVHIPTVRSILQVVETWPQVYESGQIQVYKNPQL